MFSVNLHEFKPIQALDCINLNMIIHKYELLPGLIGADILTKKHQKATMEQGSYDAKFDINANAKSLIHLYRPIDQTEILFLKI